MKQHETDEVYDSLFVDDEQQNSIYANKFIACSNRIPKKQARTLQVSSRIEAPYRLPKTAEHNPKVSR